MISLLFKKKYHDKKMECPHCHETNNPIIKRNRLGNSIGLYGRVGVDNNSTYRKYLLVCPNCKYILSTK